MKQNSRGIVHLLVLLILTIIIFAGISYWAYKNGINLLRQDSGGQEKLTPTPTPAETISQASNGNLVNWKIYTSKDLEISFKYPENFRVSENYTPGTGLIDGGIFVDLNQTEGTPTRWMKITRTDKSDFWNFTKSELVYNLQIGKTYTDPKNKTVQLKRIEDIVIEDISWHVYELNEQYQSPHPVHDLITPKEDKYYIITLTYSNTPEFKVDFVKTFDQILSTFRFLDNKCPEGEELKTCKLGPCCCPEGAICD